MIFTIKVTTGGRFTVPKELRDLFDWKYGDRLVFSVSKSEVTIVKKNEFQKHVKPIV